MVFFFDLFTSSGGGFTTPLSSDYWFGHSTNDSSFHIDHKIYFDYHNFFTYHETASLIRTINFPFHTIHSLFMLWFALARSELNVLLSLGDSVKASD
jgi:hypothetical protein